VGDVFAIVVGLPRHPTPWEVGELLISSEGSEVEGPCERQGGRRRNVGGYSVLPEADRRDQIGSLVGLPRLTVVFRDMDVHPETDDDTTTGSI
jgi:hypothetical protein